jgi:hypothetical protein
MISSGELFEVVLDTGNKGMLSTFQPLIKK